MSLVMMRNTSIELDCLHIIPQLEISDGIKCLIFVFIIVLALCGNVLVIVSVVRSYKLRRQLANYFVISLAVADLMVAIVAMFFNGIRTILRGHWIFGSLMCDLFNATDVVVCTASILNLFFISLYRYFQIVKEPLSYGQTFTKFRVLLIITFIWCISFVIAFVPIFTRIYTTHEFLEAQIECQCNFEVNLPYCIVSSSISFWIPSAGICYFYYHIYHLAAKTAREDAHRKQSSSTTFLTYQPSHSQSIYVHSNNFSQSVTDLNLRSESSIFLTVKNSFDGRSRSVSTDNNGPLFVSGGSTGLHTTESVHESLKAHIKAAKTLLIILLTFFICWTPFFINYDLTFIASFSPPESWVLFVWWLGYFNSCLNPFIYAWKFKDFQEAFVDTLGCIFCNCSKQSYHNSSHGETWHTNTTGVYLEVRGNDERKKSSV